MIRALFLLIVSFISITTFGQKPFKYAGRGIQMTEMWADSVARIPSDTVRNKTGIARIGVRFFVGNGTFWTEIAGGSGTGANIYNSDGSLSGNRVLDMNGHLFDITNSGTPRNLTFDNGSQYIQLHYDMDEIEINNGHTSLKVIDGISTNMINSGTATLKTDSLPLLSARTYQFPNRAGTIALTSDTAGLRELIGGKVDSVTFTSSTCVDTINVYRAGVKTQKTFDKVNGLLSGGEVTPGANDTTFNVAAAVYNAQCVRYTSDATPITLNGNSDSAKGRIDVIYTQAGNVGAIQGQNLTNPIAPALTASQIGLATVYFPPLSDSGITNIYNVTNVNGIDSNAIRTVAVTADSLCFIFTSLLRTDTICSSRSTAIDSLRRLAGSTNVQARKGGVWITQFTDSVGSGGGGGATTSAIDQILRNGNRTRQKIIWDDTSSVAGSGIYTDELYPRNYNTSYTNGTQSYFSRGYGYYPNVNLPDTRPNVVWLLAGYNGGFNNPTIAGEHTWGARAETYYTDMSEFHGILPEFKDRAGLSRRLGSCYVNNANGYAAYVLQIDQFQIKQGATDSNNLSLSPSGMTYGFNTNGSISMRNERSPSRSHSIALLDDGALYNIGGGVTPSVSYHTFTSPINVNSSATTGTSINATIQADVSVAGKYALSMVQKGLSTSSFGGLRADNINTTGRYNMLYGYNAGVGGIWSHLKTGSGGTASYVLSDASDGLGWLIELTGGTASKSLRFSQSNFADAFQLIGTSGNAKFKYSVAIGASDPVASALLDMQSTSKGLLVPRMTKAQRDAISSPAVGLIIWQTDNTPGIRSYNGTNWIKFSETTD